MIQLLLEIDKITVGIVRLLIESLVSSCHKYREETTLQTCIFVDLKLCQIYLDRNEAVVLTKSKRFQASLISLNNKVAKIALRKMASSNFSKSHPKEVTVVMRNKSPMNLFKASVSQTRTKSTSNRRLILFTNRGV